MYFEALEVVVLSFVGLAVGTVPGTAGCERLPAVGGHTQAAGATHSGTRKGGGPHPESAGVPRRQGSRPEPRPPDGCSHVLPTAAWSTAGGRSPFPSS